MRDPQRLTVDEFFAWQALVEGRYELVDGHIIPHPDYVTPLGFAAPDTEHGLICLNIGVALQAQLRAPCRAYVGVGVVVDRGDANIPDVAVSCDEQDRTRPALLAPRYLFEVSSPKTYRIDTGRKVAAYMAIPTIEAYVVVDRPRRSLTVYRPDAGPQTFSAGIVALGDVSLDIDAIFA